MINSCLIKQTLTATPGNSKIFTSTRTALEYNIWKLCLESNPGEWEQCHSHGFGGSAVLYWGTIGGGVTHHEWEKVQSGVHPWFFLFPRKIMDECNSWLEWGGTDYEICSNQQATDNGFILWVSMVWKKQLAKWLELRAT